MTTIEPSRRTAALLVGLVALGGCDAMNVRRGAPSVLTAFGPPSPADAAQWAIDEYDADNRARGTLALASYSFASEPVYVDVFRENITDQDPAVRAAAAFALGNHGGLETADLLIAALDDPSGDVRLAAARALQRVHSDDAIDPLLQRIREETEEEETVRAAAACALGQYDETRVVNGLIAALDDEDLVVARFARESLRTLTGQDFGYEPRMWLSWIRRDARLFQGKLVYQYPVFNRPKNWIEYLPFYPQPPNEVSSTPVGMPLPGVGG